MNPDLRSVLEAWLDERRVAYGSRPPAYDLRSSAIRAALARIDVLEAEAAGLLPLRDRAEENAAWIAYGAEREREAVVVFLTREFERLIDAIRARGPLAPPAPWETLAARVAELEAGTQLLVQQLRNFPTGEHDDGPDALAPRPRRMELPHDL